MGLIIDEGHRFRMLISGIIVGVGISTTYGFSLFTEHMKVRYGFTQGDITTISTVGNVMANCAILLGILLDFTGPKVQLLCSGTLGALGMLLFGLTFDGTIDSPDRSKMVVYFSVFSGIMFLGCPSLDGGSIMPLMMNFPLDRGYMVIIQKTFSGLGTSVLMLYFNAWFRSGDVSDGKQYASYSYFLAVQVLLCAVVGVVFMNFPAYSPCEFHRSRMTPEELEEAQRTLQVYMQQRPPYRRLYLGCLLVFLLLLFLTAVSTYGAFVNISVTGYRVLWAVAIAIIISFTAMLAPVKLLGEFPHIDGPSKFIGLGEAMDMAEDAAALVRADGEGSRQGEAYSAGREPAGDDEDDDAEVAGSGPAAKTRRPTDAEEPNKEEEGDESEAAVALPVLTASGDPQYTGSFWSHLLTIDLWLMWLSFFGMLGTGIVLIFNSAQIYRSKNYGKYVASHQALYVALIGVGSAIGRIASGLLDMLVTRRRARGQLNIYTTLFYPIGALLLAFAFCFFVIVPVEGIVLPFVIGAMGNGMGWGLGALCVRIIYVEDLGKHYNFMWTSGLVATIGLNRFMFGKMFDAQADKAGTSPFCNAPVCINGQMWILCGVNVMSTCAALGLHFRFSRFANSRLAAISAMTSDNTDPGAVSLGGGQA